jgi:hypothetical protein
VLKIGGVVFAASDVGDLNEFRSVLVVGVFEIDPTPAGQRGPASTHIHVTVENHSPSRRKRSNSGALMSENGENATMRTAPIYAIGPVHWSL